MRTPFNLVADYLARAPERQSSGSDPYEDCGVTKGCFGLGDPCIQTRDCTVLLSFSLAAQGDGFDFEMTGGVAVTNNMWIAAGLTDTHNMGTASVVDCFLYDGQPGMQESWNTDAEQNIVQTPVISKDAA
ncbi:putative ferric-chelate reductase 1 homolog [Dermacentor albipictus]|uniref:putative ferric-chelate reductase 1 homolog n=1 Tax=Dermacentor albipictus TaxID=60249 RepID=UPI0038FCCE2C